MKTGSPLLDFAYKLGASPLVAGALGFGRPVAFAVARQLPKALFTEGGAKLIQERGLPESIAWAQDAFKKEQLQKFMPWLRRYFSDKEHGAFRSVFFGGLGAVAGANVIGADPFGAVSTVANPALALGTNVVLGKTLASLPFRGAKVLGMGYLGLTALNLLRPGNQTGPM